MLADLQKLSRIIIIIISLCLCKRITCGG